MRVQHVRKEVLGFRKKNGLTDIHDDNLAGRYSTYQHVTLFVGRDLYILSRCLILQQDSSTQHSAHQTEDVLNLFHWEILDHPPQTVICLGH